MNITLSSALENFVKETVATGLYNNESEVVNEALRLLQVKEKKRKALFEALDKGFEDLEADRYTTYTPELLDNMADDVISKSKK